MWLALNDLFTIEMSELLDEVNIVEQDGAIRTHSQGIAVTRRRRARTGGRAGRLAMIVGHGDRSVSGWAQHRLPARWDARSSNRDRASIITILVR
jgi:hypothetical protein